MGRRLVIVGTIHVDPSSVSQAGDIVIRLSPQVVALELDEARLSALVSQGAGIQPKMPGDPRRPIWLGLPVLLISVMERFAGSITGSAPGKEMAKAAEEARRIGAHVALIDLPIDRTIGMLRTIPKTEKLRLVLDSVASLVVLPFGSSSLNEASWNMTGHIEAFRSRYPALSRLLIDIREEYMADQLRRLLDQTSGRIVAIVGLGHLASLAKKLTPYAEKEESIGYRLAASWTIST